MKTTTSAYGLAILTLLAALVLGVGCERVDNAQEAADSDEETPVAQPAEADTPEADVAQPATAPEPEPRPVAAAADTVVVVTISEEQFSEIYPAMWFSPSTGEVSPLLEESEDPPAPQYECWVEPRDPEFAFSSDEGVGFAFVGKGDGAFEADPPDDVGEFSSELDDPLDNGRLPVFFVQGEGGSCLIQILKWDPDNSTIEFKWRKLD